MKNKEKKRIFAAFAAGDPYGNLLRHSSLDWDFWENSCSGMTAMP